MPAVTTLNRFSCILTSFGSLKLLVGAGRTLALAVVHADVEGVEAEGVQARQHAAAVVAVEVEDVLLHVVRVVFVLLPVVHLREQCIRRTTI